MYSIRFKQKFKINVGGIGITRKEGTKAYEMSRGKNLILREY